MQPDAAEKYICDFKSRNFWRRRGQWAYNRLERNSPQLEHRNGREMILKLSTPRLRELFDFEMVGAACGVLEELSLTMPMSLPTNASLAADPYSPPED